MSSHGPGKVGAKLRGIAMSPKKINLFATLVRGMHVEDALAQCRLHPKKAGKIIAGVGPSPNPRPRHCCRGESSLK